MNEVLIIAEIAQAHDGSLGIAHSYIDALANTGVDAIKFQTHIAEAESSIYEPFRVKFSYEDDTRFDYWKRMEFTLDQWKELKAHCISNGLEFISSPFSNTAIDLLEEIGVKRYKVGSGEVNNLLMMEKLARTGKPIIVSSGMSSWIELEQTINFFKTKEIPVSLLQCTTAYPTVAGQWGLFVISEMKQRFNIPIGFSDHSGEIFPSIAAVSLGAEILEFHAVFDKRMFGPDAIASLEIDEIKKLVNAVRKLELDFRNRETKILNDEKIKLKKIFEKSLAVNKDLHNGHVLTFEDLEAKKPKGYGIDAKYFQTVIGKKLKKPLKANEFLKETNIK